MTMKKNDKVKLSKDGSSIDFVASDSLPTSTKKFRQSPEIEGFYRFIFENDLRSEAAEILDRIIVRRKEQRKDVRKDVRKDAFGSSLAGSLASSPEGKPKAARDEAGSAGGRKQAKR